MNTLISEAYNAEFKRMKIYDENRIKLGLPQIDKRWVTPNRPANVIYIPISYNDLKK